jgi:hypothetical protein
MHFEASSSGIAYGFFPKKNPIRSGATSHEMLRTLEDEVPAQMGENGEIHCTEMLKISIWLP